MFSNISVTCLRGLNESTDSSSFSSDDEEATTSPTGVSTIQSAGPGESQGRINSEATRLVAGFIESHVRSSRARKGTREIDASSFSCGRPSKG